MTISTFSYPDRDEVPYLEWFDPHFSSVFIALNPFIRIYDGEPQSDGNWLPHEVEMRAKRSRQECAVAWAEVAALCGFETIRDVNQSLRRTGSKRLAPKYASEKNTATMVRKCRENSIYTPDEGCSSPPFEWSLADFAAALGQETLLAGHGFTSTADQLKVSQLADPEQLNPFAELAAIDKSFYATIYTDYHYWFICQTTESLSKARPNEFFEGFYADSATNDFWGIPGYEPVVKSG